MEKVSISFACALPLILSTQLATAKEVSAVPKNVDKPNVIFILCDDLGYADIGCYGQKKIKTPHIDRLAQNGMLFTNHYSGSTVSAPSRCCLLTGMHTGHAEISGNKELGEEGQFPMSDQSYTLGMLFQQAGYQTAAFGKWGLGYPGSTGDPNNQGFTEFLGYNCQRLAHRYYPTHLWHNQERVELPGNEGMKKCTTYAPDVIHEATLKYIEKHQNEPFFIYYPLVQPHAELVVPEDKILAKYKGKFPEKPYVDRGAKGRNNYGSDKIFLSRYCDQEIPRATFAAMVARIDQYVGDIEKKLVELNLDKNTIIVFTSDNGPHREGGADPDFFDSNGPFRGYKRSLTDGGVRVPLIVKWPAKVEAGRVSYHTSAFWDWMGTFGDILAKTSAIDKSTLKTASKNDGLSIYPTLCGKSKKQKEHDFLYWQFQEQGGKQAVRMGDWKAIRYRVSKNPNSPIELYNIVDDPAELHNVASAHPALVKQAEKYMKSSHTRNPNYLFDYEK